MKSTIVASQKSAPPPAVEERKDHLFCCNQFKCNLLPRPYHGSHFLYTVDSPQIVTSFCGDGRTATPDLLHAVQI
jgi:hypothetical protein